MCPSVCLFVCASAGGCSLVWMCAQQAVPMWLARTVAMNAQGEEVSLDEVFADRVLHW